MTLHNKIPMKYFLFLSLSLLFLACKSEVETVEEVDNVSPSVVTPVEKNIEILFDEKDFSEPKAAQLLNELKICNPNQKNKNNASEPVCDPKFFHILPFIENEKIENAFLLVIRAGVHDWPLRRLLVYQREQGKLVLVNTFVAHLIGSRKSSTKHDDLILQFFDEYENRLQCVYKWKENRYQYDCVEKIEGRRIKKELQDSMNVEIAKVISQNNMAM